jgi:ubiquinol-cytochrome c reductase iron-sulfur subunit
MSTGNGSRRSVRSITFAFGVSAISSLGLAVVYLLGGQPQVEGVLLGGSLGGISVALVLWARHLMPEGPEVQDREVTPKAAEERPQAERALKAGAQAIERRSFLTKMVGAAFGALGSALLFPIRSLGEAPARALFRTAWRPGARMVRPDGSPVRPEDLAIDGILTVFPEEHADEADSQTLLIRLPEDVEAPGPAGWSHEGFVAFSKICTHAGCPVGLYEATSRKLFCPCHQSVFDVLQGAKPTEGPATRALPQLPISIDGEGFLVAQKDFDEPVGPGYWNRGRDD